MTTLEVNPRQVVDPELHHVLDITLDEPADSVVTPEHAEPVIDALVARLRELGAVVATGRFRAHMLVELVNDGPVTVILDV